MLRIHNLEKNPDKHTRFGDDESWLQWAKAHSWNGRFNPEFPAIDTTGASGTDAATADLKVCQGRPSSVPGSFTVSPFHPRSDLSLPVD